MKLEDDTNFSQLICIDCKTFMETYMKFCEKIDNHQKELKFENEKPAEDPLIVVKTEKTSDICIRSVESINVPAELEYTPMTDDMFMNDFEMNSFHDDFVTADQDNDEFDSDEHVTDDELLPPIVRENVETLKLRCKDCSVVLQNLPIIFVPSDTEDDEDEEPDIPNTYTNDDYPKENYFDTPENLVSLKNLKKKII